MSLLKSVPEGLKPHECERIKLREPPPVPYMPTKEKVQDEVVKLRNLQIKTTIKKDTTLNFQVWRKNGTREAFLMQGYCGTQCNQETWSFLQLREGCKGPQRIHEGR